MDDSELAQDSFCKLGRQGEPRCSTSLSGTRCSRLSGKPDLGHVCITAPAEQQQRFTGDF
jgi:hypothetical protein